MVLVPDFTTKAPKSNLDTFWANLSTVLSPEHIGVSPLVVGFEYGGEKSFESIWHFLSLQGDTLLDCIMQQLGETQVCAIVSKRKIPSTDLEGSPATSCFHLPWTRWSSPKKGIFFQAI